MTAIDDVLRIARDLGQLVAMNSHQNGVPAEFLLAFARQVEAEAFKKAAEACEDWKSQPAYDHDIHYNTGVSDCVESIRALSAQPSPDAAQEPVATVQFPDPEDERDGISFSSENWRRLDMLVPGTNLYTQPVQKPEPSGWLVTWPNGYYEFWRHPESFDSYKGDGKITPLYTSPQPVQGVAESVADEERLNALMVVLANATMDYVQKGNTDEHFKAMVKAEDSLRTFFKQSLSHSSKGDEHGK